MASSDYESRIKSGVVFAQNYILYRYWIENNKNKPIPKIFMKNMNKCEDIALKKKIINDKKSYDFVIKDKEFKDVYKKEKTIFKNIGDLDDEDLRNVYLADSCVDALDKSNHIKLDFHIRSFFSGKKSNYKCFTFSEEKRRLGWFDDIAINEIFKEIKKTMNDGEDIKISKKTFDLGGVNWFTIEFNSNEKDSHPCFFAMAHSDYFSKGRIFYFRTENNRDLMFDYLS